MREALLVYGLCTGFGLFVVAGWMTAAAISGGTLPGAGLNVNASVTGPLAIACFIVAIHCILRLVKEAR